MSSETSVLELRLITVFKLQDDGWYIDVEEGWVGQPMSHISYGPIPFEQLFSVEDDIRQMRQREIADMYRSLMDAARDMQTSHWEFRL